MRLFDARSTGNSRSILKIAVIVCLVALMTTAAWGRQRRHYESGGDLPWRDYESCYGGGCYQESSSDSLLVQNLVSSIPEPSATLLFMVGGLVVAQGIRGKRKNSRR